MMMMMTFLHWLAAIRLSEGNRLPGWLVLLLPAGAELGQKTVEKSDHPSLRLTS